MPWLRRRCSFFLSFFDARSPQTSASTTFYNYFAPELTFFSSPRRQNGLLYRRLRRNRSPSLLFSTTAGRNAVAAIAAVVVCPERLEQPPLDRGLGPQQSLVDAALHRRGRGGPRCSGLCR